MQKSTEQVSKYNNLEQMSTNDLLQGINNEDKTVAFSVEKKLPEIARLIIAALPLLKQGGRLFYIGSGTSGRLGVVDASECPPTFGVAPDVVIGIIAGGDAAIRAAQEFAEDEPMQGWYDLEAHKVSTKDVVIGISASGRTPYVLGALRMCAKNGITTACICANEKTLMAELSTYPIEISLGPEFVTGSTRMKAGTAQKLVLNMISTALMIQLGKVMGNKMVDMQLSNHKLIDRGTRMIMEHFPEWTYNEAKEKLLLHGSVRKVLNESQIK